VEYTRINGDSTQKQHARERYQEATEHALGTEADLEAWRACDAAGDIEVEIATLAHAEKEHKKQTDRVLIFGTHLGDDKPLTTQRDILWLELNIKGWEEQHAILAHRLEAPHLYDPVVVGQPGHPPVEYDVAEHARASMAYLDAKHGWAIAKLAELQPNGPDTPPAPPKPVLSGTPKTPTTKGAAQ
jgi:hypothetical protein